MVFERPDRCPFHGAVSYLSAIMTTYQPRGQRPASFAKTDVLYQANYCVRGRLGSAAEDASS